MSSESEREGSGLLFRLRELAPHEPQHVLRGVLNYLETKKLRAEITPVLVLGQEERVSLEAITSYGEQVLTYVVETSSAAPCPTGMCEPTTFGLCRWCGTLRRH